MVCIIDSKQKRAKIKLLHAVKVKTFTACNSSFVYIDATYGLSRKLHKLLYKKNLNRVLLTENAEAKFLDEMIERRMDVVERSNIHVDKACMAAVLYLKQRVKGGLKTAVTIIDNEFNDNTQRLISEISNYTPYVAIITKNSNRFYYLSKHIYSETGIAILLLNKAQFGVGVDLIISVNESVPSGAVCPAIELYSDRVRYLNVKPAFEYKREILDLAKTLDITADILVLAMERNFVDCCDILHG